ncbi:MAG: hypothetical protein IIB17_02330 [Chloroflexi bacterium]|nr:hypothetical protein [Chloroflexota bacterium]
MAQQTPDFPIPEGIEGFWVWDKMHGPRPLTPYTQDLFIGDISIGFTRGMVEFDSPVGIQQMSVNSYVYMAIVPIPLEGETFEERVAKHEHTMHETLPELGNLWADQWLPSIIPGLEAAKSRDYTSLDDAALIQTMSSMREEFLDRYTIHGKINFVMMSASMYADFYNESISPDDPTEPYETLQGFATRSLDAGHGLWELSRSIRGNTTVNSVFNESESHEIMSQLEQTSDGQTFLADFRSYLDEFGWRAGAFEFADLTWREDPTIPLNTLQGYIQLDDSGDPLIKFNEAVARRDELLAAARNRLAGDPAALGKFNGLYDMARHYLPLTENHNYYIDQIGNSIMRLPVLEIGRRLLERGTIDSIEDVFMLYINEQEPALGGQDFKSTIAERKADHAKWSKVIPVPTIGTPPEPSGAPMEAAFAKMFGTPPEPSQDPNVIQGIGASPGVVQGTAKVVRTLSEASKLQPGDILVCEMTMPPWTPLFSIASAVVADTGGVLSHCAIVSREYRMPCVVGTLMGTAVIQDGMTLTVDGSTGVVRIDSRG